MEDFSYFDCHRGVNIPFSKAGSRRNECALVCVCVHCDRSLSLRRLLWFAVVLMDAALWVFIVCKYCFQRLNDLQASPYRFVQQVRGICAIYRCSH